MPDQKTLFMESTEISADKTAAEISNLLFLYGARQVSFDYAGSKLTGLKFALEVQDMLVSFQLPARTDPVYQVLLKKRKTYVSQQDKIRIRAQSERVAWRQVLRWLQAQLAMIETGMVQAHEVFLPYLVHAGTGQTLFEYFQADGLKQIAAPAKKEK